MSKLTPEVIPSIMQEGKSSQREQLLNAQGMYQQSSAPGTPAQKVEDTIVKALEFYRKRQWNHAR